METSGTPIAIRIHLTCNFGLSLPFGEPLPHKQSSAMETVSGVRLSKQ